MNCNIRPARSVFAKSSEQREVRMEAERQSLEKTIPDLIASRSEEGYFSCTLSFLNEDMNINFDQREIFIEEFDPILKSLGYKVIYSDGTISRHVMIDWDERFRSL